MTVWREQRYTDLVRKVVQLSLDLLELLLGSLVRLSPGLNDLLRLVDICD